MRGGFTLVELLVALAIIGVLAALLLPVFARARGKAAAATCLSNLHQIGTAIPLYIQDWDENLPNGNDGRKIFNAEADAGPHIYDQIRPYTRTNNLFHCPSDAGATIDDTDYAARWSTRSSLFQQIGSSYFYQISGSYPDNISYAEVDPVATSAALWDGSGAWHSGAPLVPSDSSLKQWVTMLADYHYNTLFFDWHVHYISQHDLSVARFGY